MNNKKNQANFDDTNKLILQRNRLEKKLSEIKKQLEDYPRPSEKLKPFFLVRRKDDNGFNLDIMRVDGITTYEGKPAYSYKTAYSYDGKINYEHNRWFIKSIDRFFRIVTKAQLKEYVKQYNKKYSVKFRIVSRNKFMEGKI